MMRTRRQAKDESTESTEAPTSSVGVSDDLTEGQGTNSDMANNIAAGSEESVPAETSSARQKTSSADGILHEANVSKKRSKWDSSRVLTDPSSPLTSVNLRRILTSPNAWDGLADDQKCEVARLFPNQDHILPGVDGGPPRLNVASLMNDDGFHHDCQTYLNNLAGGQHDLKWLAKAFQAHQRRKSGDFDSYLRDKFEKDFGVECPGTGVAGSKSPPPTADASPQTELQPETPKTNAQP